MRHTDRRNLGWRVTPWVLWPLAIFEQAIAWKRLLALGLLVAGCADDAEETRTSGPPLCACDPSFEGAIEVVDAGAHAGHLEPRDATPRDPGGTAAVEGWR